MSAFWLLLSIVAICAAPAALAIRSWNRSRQEPPSTFDMILGDHIADTTNLSKRRFK